MAVAACPVCGESFGERPQRCYRCETSLEAWWSFENALAGLTVGHRSEETTSTKRHTNRAGRAFGLVAAGAMLGAMAILFFLRHFEPTPPPGARPVVSVRPTVSPIVGTPASRAVTYTVQPGDSAWRISAALLGDGRRWRELWPSGGEPLLLAGSRLSLELSPPR